MQSKRQRNSVKGMEGENITAFVSEKTAEDLQGKKSERKLNFGATNAVMLSGFSDIKITE